MVSIIIPVYNTGTVLNKCLRSIIRQTYTDWECILVDDCSTDGNTKVLLDKWNKQDSRFVLIRNKKNLGIEKNRFVGLSAVKGEYVMFIDHDDWLYDKFALQSLVDNAIETKADVVIGRHKEHVLGVGRLGYFPVDNGIIRQPELKEKYYCSYFGVNLMPVLVWARLYTKDLIDRAKMKPHGLRYSDDVAWNLFIMPFAQSVSVVPDIIYVHNWGGLSSTYSNALEEYKLFYGIRRKAMVRFDFPDARKWLDIEMKNILREYIRQQICLQRLDDGTILTLLEKEMKQPIWKEIELTMIAYRDDLFTKAMLDRDVQTMFSIIKQQVNTPKERIKQCVRWIMRMIYKFYKKV
ncbi:MAG: glycosyltransferase family 2 protein [Bacteroidaceae bacterium]|nr:glycosyltransferase family 2 protein [Bacteroidaceae bacterium]